MRKSDSYAQTPCRGPDNSNAKSKSAPLGVSPPVITRATEHRGADAAPLAYELSR